MKPWAKRSANERAGVVVGVGAAVITLFFGFWKLGPGSAPAVTDAPSQAGQTAATGQAADAPTEATTETAAGETAATETAATDTTATDTAATDTAAGDEVQGSAVAATEPVTDAGADGAVDAAASGDVAADVNAGAASDAAEATDATPEAAAPSDAVVPGFDLVRVTPDGSAVLAGSGAPGSTILLRLDGAEIGSVPADAQGNFVALFNLAPSVSPRVLTLAMRLADGTEVAAPGRIVVAPTVAPEPPAVAAVPDETATADATDTADAAEAAQTATAAPAQAPAALLVTDEGARVLQSGQDLSPAMASNVTVDTITYTPEGDVQFSGRGTGDAIIRLYLDNRQIADAVVDGLGGWAVTMPGIDPGIYTLRVDQLDAGGKVTSRFETPFKRETMEALAAAAQAEQAAADAAAEAAADAAMNGSEAATGEADPAKPVQPVSVTVQPGFTLWRIARENLGDGVLYVQVFEANKGQIRNPDLIYPGQVFSIPSGN